MTNFRWTGQTSRSGPISRMLVRASSTSFWRSKGVRLLGLTRERKRSREIILSNWRWQSRARVVVENGNIDGWCRTTSLMAKWDDDVDYCLLGRRALAAWNIRTTNQDVEYFHAKMPPIFKLAIIFQLHQKPTVGEIFIDETNAIADCRLNCIFKA